MSRNAWLFLSLSMTRAPKIRGWIASQKSKMARVIVEMPSWRDLSIRKIWISSSSPLPMKSNALCWLSHSSSFVPSSGDSATDSLLSIRRFDINLENALSHFPDLLAISGHYQGVSIAIKKNLLERPLDKRLFRHKPINHAVLDS